ncbi:Trace amine-associated receptor 13c [Acropora cervicornis]|uniref:Trace amine-associated receptor 13c n=1 Tax=Acropora cervicornis TaxID=6130 RepID=A0AAD9Q1W2_ACRCE|nr:Trace amine-associated receptor 13c [Acropora cervicornis]
MKSICEIKLSTYVYIFLVARRLEISTVQLSQNGSIEENKRNHRKERKAAKTIAMILGVAITCWIPFLIISRIFAKEQDVDLIVSLMSSLQVLSVCNSSLNPYIYCVRSQRYYVAFIKLLGLQKILSKKVRVTSRVLPHGYNLPLHARTPCQGKAVFNDVTA